MNVTVLHKTYTAPPFNEREILRYAACKSETDEMTALLHACLTEAQHKLTYAVCYTVLPLHIEGTRCDFGVFSVQAPSFAAHLNGCDRAVVLAATVGVEVDRLIARYSQLSPTKALMFQAIGTERIEALCDAFCADIAAVCPVDHTTRFSPGYGDLPLTVQRDIFAVLNCPKHIGLTLCDSLLMSPSKSITAFVGLKRNEVVL